MRMNAAASPYTLRNEYSQTKYAVNGKNFLPSQEIYNRPRKTIETMIREDEDKLEKKYGKMSNEELFDTIRSGDNKGNGEVMYYLLHVKYRSRLRYAAYSYDLDCDDINDIIPEIILEFDKKDYVNLRTLKGGGKALANYIVTTARHLLLQKAEARIIERIDDPEQKETPVIGSEGVHNIFVSRDTVQAILLRMHLSYAVMLYFLSLVDLEERDYAEILIAKDKMQQKAPSEAYISSVFDNGARAFHRLVREETTVVEIAKNTLAAKKALAELPLDVLTTVNEVLKYITQSRIIVIDELLDILEKFILTTAPGMTRDDFDQLIVKKCTNVYNTKRRAMVQARFIAGRLGGEFDNKNA